MSTVSFMCARSPAHDIVFQSIVSRARAQNIVLGALSYRGCGFESQWMQNKIDAPIVRSSVITLKKLSFVLFVPLVPQKQPPQLQNEQPTPNPATANKLVNEIIEYQMYNNTHLPTHDLYRVSQFTCLPAPIISQPSVLHCPPVIGRI